MSIFREGNYLHWGRTMAKKINWQKADLFFFSKSNELNHVTHYAGGD